MAPIVVGVRYGTRHQSGTNLDTNDAIGAVKHKIIAQRPAVPPHNEMMLFFSGKLLLDHTRLVESRISAGQTLEMRRLGQHGHVL
ncbi:hypothetical protein niasHT_024665 [Heterodera trifolii]|uniref:Ubiquitin-like domain-containing protein n=1 Tax=Heterodera trifolii TaxID=157864 RepID=A0ABD2K7M7_9BILA